MILMDKWKKTHKNKNNKPHDQNNSKMVLMDKSEKQKYCTAKTAPKLNWEMVKTYIIDSPNSHIYD
jgi:hypothetical protein